MRAFTPRAASLRTSASASGRVLYAASWMVQMPRGADPFVAGSFAAGTLALDALGDAVVLVVRPVVVSVRDGRLVFGVAPAGAGLAVGPLLDERGGGDDATVGDPEGRTLGVVVLGAG